MVISKLIRNNKRFIKKTDYTYKIKPLVVRNQPAPMQDRVRHFIKEHPNCIISDIYKGIPDADQANIRSIIRIMIEGHRVKQHFTID